MSDVPKKATRKLAMLAMCHNCTGEYYDGKIDCEVAICPLYPWMPYASSLPDETWLKHNPRMKGKILWEDCGKTMTEEQRQAAAERLRSYRKKGAKNALLDMIDDD